MLDLSKNHFELFDMPVGFGVDLGALASRYRDLQRVVHPDRYVNATDRERRLSMQATTRINEAYRILSDPLARAGYMLSLKGIGLEAAGGGAAADAEFLMQQMAFREELAEVRQTADPLVALNDLMARVEKQIDDLSNALAEHFSAATPERMELARAAVHKMQFLRKLRAEAESVEAQMDDTL